MAGGDFRQVTDKEERNKAIQQARTFPGILAKRVPTTCPSCNCEQRGEKEDRKKILFQDLGL